MSPEGWDSTPVSAPSVHVAIRLPWKLHEAVVHEVERSGRTLSEVVRSALVDSLLPRKDK